MTRTDYCMHYCAWVSVAQRHGATYGEGCPEQITESQFVLAELDKAKNRLEVLERAVDRLKAEKKTADPTPRTELTPEWPKVGEQYIWNMEDPINSKGVVVTQVYWCGAWWLVEHKSKEDVFTNTLDHFQERCRFYYDKVIRGA